MECRRCRGLMVVDGLVCMNEEMVWLTVWRCMNCGDLLDRAIASNRRSQSPDPGPVVSCVQG
ncbi:hypothetical protein [Nitrospira sp. Kam-Ns4a]